MEYNIPVEPNIGDKVSLREYAEAFWQLGIIDSEKEQAYIRVWDELGVTPALFRQAYNQMMNHNKKASWLYLHNLLLSLCGKDQ